MDRTAHPHALKKAPPKRISFVAAVTKYGDNWRFGIPLMDVGTEERTQDSREYQRMCSMERGTLSRVGHFGCETLDDYEPMLVGEHGFGYCAVREGYDGAPDSRCPIGVARTKIGAIAALLDAEELAAS